MKNYGQIVVVQRTACGHDKSGRTKMYIINSASGVVIRHTKKCESDETLMGYITIVHPAIMVGTSEEIYNDFVRCVEKTLLEKGVIREVDYGYFTEYVLA